MGLPYDYQVDMWSLGCILAEITTGRPLFPAQDENELLEYFKVRIGLPPLEMIQACSKRKQFFDCHNNLIRSRKSRLPANAWVNSIPVKDYLVGDKDLQFVDFIESCLKLDPLQRLTPEQALQHRWLKSPKVFGLLNGRLSEQLHDLESVLGPMPTK